MAKKEDKKGVIKSKLLNILYALVLQFVFIPLLGFITYDIYDRVAFLGSVSDSLVVFIVIVVGLVILNLVAIYGIAYLFKVVYKFDLLYFTVIGLITSVSALWIKVYYITVENAECVVTGSIRCLDANSTNTMFGIILIFAITYYLMYLTVHKMVEKQLELKEKEQ